MSIILSVILIVLVVAGVIHVNRKFATKKGKEYIPTGGRFDLWAHRGFLKNNNEENTMEAFRDAVENGADGIEMDVQFNEIMNKFVVSHDIPYKAPGGNLLFLEDVFKEFQRNTKYWIDFKNLRTGNKLPAFIRLEYLMKTYKTFDITFVESNSGLALRYFSLNGINTIYGIKYDKKEFQFIFENFYNKLLILNSRFKGIVVPSWDVSDELVEEYKNYSLFVFTINDEETLKKYEEYPNIKSVVTDRLFVK